MVYLKALKVAPTDWELQEELAKFLWEEGVDAPFVHIESYIKRQPEDDSFRFRFIQLLIQADEYHAAKEQLDLLTTEAIKNNRTTLYSYIFGANGSSAWLRDHSKYRRDSER